MINKTSRLFLHWVICLFAVGTTMASASTVNFIEGLIKFDPVSGQNNKDRVSVSQVDYDFTDTEYQASQCTVYMKIHDAKTRNYITIASFPAEGQSGSASYEPLYIDHSNGQELAWTVECVVNNETFEIALDGQTFYMGDHAGISLYGDVSCSILQNGDAEVIVNLNGTNVSENLSYGVFTEFFEADGRGWVESETNGCNPIIGPKTDFYHRQMKCTQSNGSSLQYIRSKLCANSIPCDSPNDVRAISCSRKSSSLRK